MKGSFLKYNVFVCLISLSFCLNAQNKQATTIDNKSTEKTRILFVVDCSNNMSEKWQSDTKINITQRLLTNIIDTLSNYNNVECALRVFGNEKDYTVGDCDDSHLLVPFYRLNGDNIKAKLKTLIPKGTSTVAKSLMNCAEDFPRDRHSRNIVVMIVNNIDKCDEDIVQISASMQKKGKYLKPFIIGISKGMKNNYENCGIYYEAKGEIDFSKALNTIIKQALHNTTIQVNLLNIKNENTETDVPLLFYDSESHRLRYSFIHSLNSLGQSDTLQIDPLIEYDIVVATKPKVEKKKLSFLAGEHSLVKISCPQGVLNIKYVYNPKAFQQKTYPVAIKTTDKKEIINVQNINTQERYLVGYYDLEVMTLPRMRVDSVEITQSSMTTIEIPEIGNLRIDKQNSNLRGSLFVKKGQDYEWVIDLDESKTKESLDLLPGEYMIVAKSLTMVKSQNTIVQELKIESNKTTNITLSVK